MLNFKEWLFLEVFVADKQKYTTWSEGKLKQNVIGTK